MLCKSKNLVQPQGEGEGKTPEIIERKIIKAVEWPLIQKLSSFVRKQRTAESSFVSTFQRPLTADLQPQVYPITSPFAGAWARFCLGA